MVANQYTTLKATLTEMGAEAQRFAEQTSHHKKEWCADLNNEVSGVSENDRGINLVYNL